MSVVFGAFAAVMLFSGRLAGADTVIREVVTDNSGKPIRGALARAQEDYKIITRFSQKDAKFEISVPSGNYSVPADAFGYASIRADKDTAKVGDVNFKLSPCTDVSRLSGEDIKNLLPDNN
jgi:hypothetical protein